MKIHRPLSDALLRETRFGDEGSAAEGLERSAKSHSRVRAIIELAAKPNKSLFCTVVALLLSSQM